MGATQDSAKRTWRFETTETLEREIYLLLQHLSGELIHELATLLRPAGTLACPAAFSPHALTVPSGLTARL